jgi:hypothetical protein
VLIQRAAARHSATRHALLLLALLSYALGAAALPPGHMAAPLSSGTAYHLCPGDARSALIINALAARDGHHHHHHHHHHHQSDADQTDAEIARAGPGCVAVGGGAELANQQFATSVEAPADAPWLADRTRTAAAPSPWLRPPARSPPA